MKRLLPVCFLLLFLASTIQALPRLPPAPGTRGSASGISYDPTTSCGLSGNTNDVQAAVDELSCGGGTPGGGIIGAQYIVMQQDGQLTAERVFNPLDPLFKLDNGANQNVDLFLDFPAAGAAPDNADLVLIEDEITGVLRSVSVSDLQAAGSSHELLSGTHSDAVTATGERGDLIYHDGSAWNRLDLALPVGGQNPYLRSNGTDVLWGVIPVSDLPSVVVTETEVPNHEANNLTNDVAGRLPLVNLTDDDVNVDYCLVSGGPGTGSGFEPNWAECPGGGGGSAFLDAPGGTEDDIRYSTSTAKQWWKDENGNSVHDPGEPIIGTIRIRVADFNASGQIDGQDIQDAIDACGHGYLGAGCEVSIPKGQFLVDTTLVIGDPAYDTTDDHQHNLRLTGVAMADPSDSGGNIYAGTVLVWNGTGSNPVIKIIGANFVDVSHLSIRMDPGNPGGTGQGDEPALYGIQISADKRTSTAPGGCASDPSGQCARQTLMPHISNVMIRGTLHGATPQAGSVGIWLTGFSNDDYMAQSIIEHSYIRNVDIGVLSDNQQGAHHFIKNSEIRGESAGIRVDHPSPNSNTGGDIQVADSVIGCDANGCAVFDLITYNKGIFERNYTEMSSSAIYLKLAGGYGDAQLSSLGPITVDNSYVMNQCGADCTVDLISGDIRNRLTFTNTRLRANGPLATDDYDGTIDFRIQLGDGSLAAGERPRFIFQGNTVDPRNERTGQGYSPMICPVGSSCSDGLAQTVIDAGVAVAINEITPDDDQFNDRNLNRIYDDGDKALGWCNGIIRTIYSGTVDDEAWAKACITNDSNNAAGDFDTVSEIVIGSSLNSEVRVDVSPALKEAWDYLHHQNGWEVGGAKNNRFDTTIGNQSTIIKFNSGVYEIRSPIRLNEQTGYVTNNLPVTIDFEGADILINFAGVDGSCTVAEFAASSTNCINPFPSGDSEFGKTIYLTDACGYDDIDTGGCSPVSLSFAAIDSSGICDWSRGLAPIVAASTSPHKMHSFLETPPTTLIPQKIGSTVIVSGATGTGANFINTTNANVGRVTKIFSNTGFCYSNPNVSLAYADGVSTSIGTTTTLECSGCFSAGALVGKGLVTRPFGVTPGGFFYRQISANTTDQLQWVSPVPGGSEPKQNDIFVVLDLSSANFASSVVGSIEQRHSTVMWDGNDWQVGAAAITVGGPGNVVSNKTFSNPTIRFPDWKNSDPGNGEPKDWANRITAMRFSGNAGGFQTTKLIKPKCLVTNPYGQVCIDVGGDIGSNVSVAKNFHLEGMDADTCGGPIDSPCIWIKYGDGHSVNHVYNKNAGGFWIGKEGNDSQPSNFSMSNSEISGVGHGPALRVLSGDNFSIRDSIIAGDDDGALTETTGVIGSGQDLGLVAQIGGTTSTDVVANFFGVKLDSTSSYIDPNGNKGFTVANVSDLNLWGADITAYDELIRPATASFAIDKIHIESSSEKTFAFASSVMALHPEKWTNTYGSINANPIQRSADIYVLDFDFDGNITDVDVQYAIDSCKQTQSNLEYGCTVRLPPGEILVSSEINTLGGTATRTGLRIVGAAGGEGVATSSECGTTLKATTAAITVLNMQNLRSAEVSNLCIDANQLADVGLQLSCSTSNCNRYLIEDVAIVNFASNDPDTVGIRVFPDSADIQYGRISRVSVRGAPGGQYEPRIGVFFDSDASNNSVDSFVIESSDISYYGTTNSPMPTGIKHEWGNITILDTTVSQSSENLHADSWAVDLELNQNAVGDGFEHFRISGLNIEAQSGNGLRICSDKNDDDVCDDAYLMGNISGNISVDNTKNCFYWEAGGSLDTHGLGCDVNGAGTVNATINGIQGKKLILSDGIVRNSAANITIGDYVQTWTGDINGIIYVRDGDSDGQVTGSDVQTAIDSCPEGWVESTSCKIVMPPGIIDVSTPILVGDVDPAPLDGNFANNGLILSGTGAGLRSSANGNAACGTTLRWNSVSSDNVLEIRAGRKMAFRDFCIELGQNTGEATSGIKAYSDNNGSNTSSISGVIIENIGIYGTGDKGAVGIHITCEDDACGGDEDQQDLWSIRDVHIRNLGTCLIQDTGQAKVNSAFQVDCGYYDTAYQIQKGGFRIDGGTALQQDSDNTDIAIELWQDAEMVSVNNVHFEISGDLIADRTSAGGAPGSNGGRNYPLSITNNKIRLECDTTAADCDQDVLNLKLKRSLIFRGNRIFETDAHSNLRTAYYLIPKSTAPSLPPVKLDVSANFYSDAGGMTHNATHPDSGEWVGVSDLSNDTIASVSSGYEVYPSGIGGVIYVIDSDGDGDVDGYDVQFAIDSCDYGQYVGGGCKIVLPNQHILVDETITIGDLQKGLSHDQQYSVTLEGHVPAVSQDTVGGDYPGTLLKWNGTASSEPYAEWKNAVVAAGGVSLIQLRNFGIEMDPGSQVGGSGAGEEMAKYGIWLEGDNFEGTCVDIHSGNTPDGPNNCPGTMTANQDSGGVPDTYCDSYDLYGPCIPVANVQNRIMHQNLLENLSIRGTFLNAPTVPVPDSVGIILTGPQNNDQVDSVMMQNVYIKGTDIGIYFNSQQAVGNVLLQSEVAAYSTAIKVDGAPTSLAGGGFVSTGNTWNCMSDGCTIFDFGSSSHIYMNENYTELTAQRVDCQDLYSGNATNGANNCPGGAHTVPQDSGSPDGFCDDSATHGKCKRRAVTYLKVAGGYGNGAAGLSPVSITNSYIRNQMTCTDVNSYTVPGSNTCPNPPGGGTGMTTDQTDGPPDNYCDDFSKYGSCWPVTKDTAILVDAGLKAQITIKNSSFLASTYNGNEDFAFLVEHDPSSAGERGRFVFEDNVVDPRNFRDSGVNRPMICGPGMVCANGIAQTSIDDDLEVKNLAVLPNGEIFNDTNLNTVLDRDEPMMASNVQHVVDTCNDASPCTQERDGDIDGYDVQEAIARVHGCYDLYDVLACTDVYDTPVGAPQTLCNGGGSNCPDGLCDSDGVTVAVQTSGDPDARCDIGGVAYTRQGIVELPCDRIDLDQELKIGKGITLKGCGSGAFDNYGTFFYTTWNHAPGDIAIGMYVGQISLRDFAIQLKNPATFTGGDVIVADHAHLSKIENVYVRGNASTTPRDVNGVVCLGTLELSVLNSRITNWKSGFKALQGVNAACNASVIHNTYFQNNGINVHASSENYLGNGGLTDNGIACSVLSISGNAMEGTSIGIKHDAPQVATDWRGCVISVNGVHFENGCSDTSNSPPYTGSYNPQSGGGGADGYCDSDGLTVPSTLRHILMDYGSLMSSGNRFQGAAPTMIEIASTNDADHVSIGDGRRAGGTGPFIDHGGSGLFEIKSHNSDYPVTTTGIGRISRSFDEKIYVHADLAEPTDVLDGDDIDLAISIAPNGGIVQLPEISIVLSSNITLGKPITIQGNGTGTVLICNEDCDVIDVKSANVTIKDMLIGVINNGGGDPDGIRCYDDNNGDGGGYSNLRVENVVISHVGSATPDGVGVRLVGCSHAAITNSQISGWNNAIRLEVDGTDPSDRLILKDNKIIGNNIGLTTSGLNSARQVSLDSNLFDSNVFSIDNGAANPFFATLNSNRFENGDPAGRDVTLSEGCLISQGNFYNTSSVDNIRFTSSLNNAACSVSHGDYFVSNVHSDAQTGDFAIVNAALNPSTSGSAAIDIIDLGDITTGGGGTITKVGTTCVSGECFEGGASMGPETTLASASSFNIELNEDNSGIDFFRVYNADDTVAFQVQDAVGRVDILGDNPDFAINETYFTSTSLFDLFLDITFANATDGTFIMSFRNGPAESDFGTLLSFDNTLLTNGVLTVGDSTDDIPVNIAHELLIEGIVSIDYDEATDETLDFSGSFNGYSFDGPIEWVSDGQGARLELDKNLGSFPTLSTNVIAFYAKEDSGNTPLYYVEEEGGNREMLLTSKTNIFSADLDSTNGAGETAGNYSMAWWKFSADVASDASHPHVWETFWMTKETLIAETGGLNNYCTDVGGDDTCDSQSARAGEEQGEKSTYGWSKELIKQTPGQVYGQYTAIYGAANGDNTPQFNLVYGMGGCKASGDECDIASRFQLRDHWRTAYGTVTAQSGSDRTLSPAVSTNLWKSIGVGQHIVYTNETCIDGGACPSANTGTGNPFNITAYNSSDHVWTGNLNFTSSCNAGSCKNWCFGVASNKYEDETQGTSVTTMPVVRVIGVFGDNCAECASIFSFKTEWIAQDIDYGAPPNEFVPTTLPSSSNGYMFRCEEIVDVNQNTLTVTTDNLSAPATDDDFMVVPYGQHHQAGLRIITQNKLGYNWGAVGIAIERDDDGNDSQSHMGNHGISIGGNSSQMDEIYAWDNGVMVAQTNRAFRFNTQPGWVHFQNTISIDTDNTDYSSGDGISIVHIFDAPNGEVGKELIFDPVPGTYLVGESESNGNSTGAYIDRQEVMVQLHSPDIGSLAKCTTPLLASPGGNTLMWCNHPFANAAVPLYHEIRIEGISLTAQATLSSVSDCTIFLNHSDNRASNRNCNHPNDQTPGNNQCDDQTVVPLANTGATDPVNGPWISNLGDTVYICDFDNDGDCDDNDAHDANPTAYWRLQIDKRHICVGGTVPGTPCVDNGPCGGGVCTEQVDSCTEMPGVQANVIYSVYRAAGTP